MKNLFLFLIFGLIGCTSMNNKSDYNDLVKKVELQKFMGDWYVLAGRFTPLENEVHNALERYTWNAEDQRIEIAFTYNKGALDGPIKSIPQKGWVYNKETNAHWKVSPLWPLKFNYLIVELADDYSWTAIGVPDQKYLWIMARDWKNPAPIVQEAVAKLKAKNYDAENLVIVPHKW